MSDWEDNFGAGFSAESLISSINHSNRMEARDAVREARRSSRSAPNQDQSDSFRFASFDEALAWEKANLGTAFVRKPEGRGYVVRVLNRR